MKACVYPGQVYGDVNVPSSKSLAHRALICASLSKGKSTIRNITMNNDIIATISGIKALGATVEIIKDTIEVTGINNFKELKSDSFDAFESASTLRFLIPIFSLSKKKIKIYGTKTLLERPLSIYKDIFGKNIAINKDHVEVKAPLMPQEYEIPGDVSSQFISGLLFTLPLLEKQSIIKVIPPFTSRSYVILTLDMLKLFGIEIIEKDEFTFIIKGNQKYKAREYKVEGDYSSAAPFVALGLINNAITLGSLNRESHQGDKAIIDIAKRMSGKIASIENGYKIFKSSLYSTTIDLDNCPDLGPVLMALCSFINGKTKFINVSRLRLKESDRIICMKEELSKFGVILEDSENEVTITPTKMNIMKEVINCHNDHRICMAMAVIATTAHNEIVIEGIECVNKSYPNFFTDLEKLGIMVRIYE